MAYTYLVLTVLMSSAQNVATKQYTNKRQNPNMLLFVAASIFFAMLFFLFSSGFYLQFNAEFVPYSVWFAVSYSAAFIGSNCAIKTGPLALSSLIISYSLVIPTLYGIIFLDEQLKALSYAGMVLLLLSLVLINVKKEEMKFSPTWIAFVVIAFIGNGMCSTVQKMQQLRFDGNYKSEFMILSLLMVSCILFSAGIVRTKKDTLRALWHTLPYAPIQGFANGAVNLFVMIMSALLPTALMFPIISAGGIVVTFFLSIFLYKEKLTKTQLIGFAVGVLSVVLLNL